MIGNGELVKALGHAGQWAHGEKAELGRALTLVESKIAVLKKYAMDRDEDTLWVLENVHGHLLSLEIGLFYLETLLVFDSIKNQDFLEAAKAYQQPLSDLLELLRLDLSVADEYTKRQFVKKLGPSCADISNFQTNWRLIIEGNTIGNITIPYARFIERWFQMTVLRYRNSGVLATSHKDAKPLPNIIRVKILEREVEVSLWINLWPGYYYIRLSDWKEIEKYGARREIVPDRQAVRDHLLFNQAFRGLTNIRYMSRREHVDNPTKERSWQIIKLRIKILQ